MALAFVEGKVISSGSSPATTPAFTNALVAGQLMVVFIGGDDGTTGNVSSVTDSKGNTYHQLPSFQFVSVGNNIMLDVWYAVITTGGAAPTVTCTFNDGNTNINVVAQYFNGFTGTPTTDVNAKSTNASSTTAALGTTAATAQAIELVVGGAVHTGATSAYTLGSGFTNLTQSNVANRSIAMQSKVVGSTGTQTGSLTIASARASLGGIVTFYDQATTTTTTTTSTTTTTTTTLAPKPKMETLVDLFNQTSLNTGLWGQFTGGGATMGYSSAGAECIYPASSTSATDGEVDSILAYDLTASYAYLQVLAIPSALTNADALMTLKDLSTSDQLRWVVEAGTLYAQYYNGTFNTVFSATFDPVAHAWWRIRESSGTIFWDTAPDGLTWTNQGSLATPFAVTALTAEVGGVCYENETSPGVFQWNNFNTLSTTMHTQTLTASVGFTGALHKNTNKNITAGLSFSGKLLKATYKSLSASVGFTGKLLKKTVKKFTGTLSFIGSWSAGGTHFLTFTAGLSFSGKLGRNISKKLTAHVSFTGVLKKAHPLLFTAGLSFTGTIKKATRKTFIAGLSFKTFFRSYIKPVFTSLTATISGADDTDTTSSGTNIAEVSGGDIIGTISSEDNKGDLQ